MKLNIEGQVNVYYVQTLCMIFYPGEKFSEDQEVTPTTPVLDLKVQENQDGYIVDASSTKKKVVYRPLHNAHRIVLCGRPYTN